MPALPRSIHTKKGYKYVTIAIPQSLADGFPAGIISEWSQRPDGSYDIHIREDKERYAQAQERLSFNWWLRKRGYSKNSCRVYPGAVKNYQEGKPGSPGYGRNQLAALRLFEEFKKEQDSGIAEKTRREIAEKCQQEIQKLSRNG